MGQREPGGRLGRRVVTGIKWMLYCGAVAIVGGAVVFVLLTAWLGLSAAEMLRETPLFGGLSPSMAAVGVLLAVCVIVLDADLGE